jgi:hypothetical protein
VPDDPIAQEPAAENPPKPKKPLVKWVLLFLISYVLISIGNYFYLKATYVPPPPPPPQEEEQPVLTIDLDGEAEEGEMPALPDSAAVEVVPEPGMALSDTTQPKDSVSTPTAELAAAVIDQAVEEETPADTVQPPPILPQEASIDSAALKRSVKLAKIVENMPAADAAEMLEPLSDAMVIDVLLRLKQRQAAKIMAEIPASRAAAISRVILEPIVQNQKMNTPNARP